MDGENNGKPYEQMDDLGTPIFGKISDLLLFLVLLLFLALLRRLQVNVRKGFKELLGSGVRFFYQSEPSPRKYPGRKSSLIRQHT